MKNIEVFQNEEEALENGTHQKIYDGNQWFEGILWYSEENQRVPHCIKIK